MLSKTDYTVRHCLEMQKDKFNFDMIYLQRYIHTHALKYIHILFFTMQNYVKSPNLVVKRQVLHQNSSTIDFKKI